MKVFVSLDAGAIAVGAERAAKAIAAEAQKRNLEIELVRNGARGMFWLEPLVEVATPAGRIGYGPVASKDVASLFDAGFLEGRPHPLCVGLVEDIPFFKRQTRLVFARCGLADPFSLDDYRSLGGLRGLERAIALGPEEIVAEVKRSGLRGRGGAGFPTGIKWETAARAAGTKKYIVCKCRRGRQRDLCRPRADGGRPVHADRGHGDCGHWGGRNARIHLHPFGISARDAKHDQGDRNCAGRRVAGAASGG